MLEDIGKMLDELLCDESDIMTAWEIEFIESIDKQRMRRGGDWEPSDKQVGILSKLWYKVNG